MSLPKTLKIGPFDCPVEFTERGDLLRDESGGTWDDVNNTIQIDPVLSEQKQWETLIHEALHGMAEMNGVELDEHDVCTLGVMIYGFLKDNADALKAIK